MPCTTTHRSWVDPNSVRKYPDDPVRELRRLHRRTARMANGFGTFGCADIALMEEVVTEIQGKMERLEFLEDKVKKMGKGSDG